MPTTRRGDAGAVLLVLVVILASDLYAVLRAGEDRRVPEPAVDGWSLPIHGCLGHLPWPHTS